MRISFLGDIMLGRKVGETIMVKGVDYVFGEILPLIENSDVIIGNLEAPFTRGGQKYTGKDPHLSFNINPDLIVALKFLRISGVTLANNHMTDYGLGGLVDTVTLLNNHEIQYSGAGRNIHEAVKPIDLPLNLGILAFNAFLPMCRIAGKNEFGVAEFTIENVQSAINLYKENYSAFIVSIHWGIDYFQYPIPGLVKKVMKILSENPNILAVVGHHPHLVQPSISFNNKKIYLSLGNFAFDEPFPLSRIGAILHLEINNNSVINEQYDIVKLDEDYRLSPLSDAELKAEQYRLDRIRKEISSNDSEYVGMDRRWIKLLLYETLRYGSITAANSLLRTYSLKEIYGNLRP